MSGSSAMPKHAPGSSVTIMQFWDANVPEAVQTLLDTVATNNADQDYRLFDDEAARALIVEEYDSRVAKLYDTCAIPAMRADLFRYCYLYQFGGMYVDADYRGMQSVQSLVDSCDRGCLYEMQSRTSDDLGICNGMMYFRHPQDPLMEQILDKALSNIEERVSPNVWSVTGPAVLRAVLARPEAEELLDGITIIDDEVFIRYFEPVYGLEYKKTDAHWFTARESGINIFKD